MLDTQSNSREAGAAHMLAHCCCDRLPPSQHDAVLFVPGTAPSNISDRGTSMGRSEDPGRTEIIWVCDRCTVCGGLVLIVGMLC